MLIPLELAGSTLACLATKGNLLPRCWSSTSQCQLVDSGSIMCCYPGWYVESEIQFPANGTWINKCNYAFEKYMFSKGLSFEMSEVFLINVMLFTPFLPHARWKDVVFSYRCTQLEDVWFWYISAVFICENLHSLKWSCDVLISVTRWTSEVRVLSGMSRVIRRPLKRRMIWL